MDYYNGHGTEIMHPIFKQKAQYMNFLRTHLVSEDALERNDNRNTFIKLINKGLLNSSSSKNDFSYKINNANYAGAHGEIRALSALLYEIERIEGITKGNFPASRLNEVDMIIRTKEQKIMQRCPCCFYLSQGVNTYGNK